MLLERMKEGKKEEIRNKEKESKKEQWVLNSAVKCRAKCQIFCSNVRKRLKSILSSRYVNKTLICILQLYASI